MAMKKVIDIALIGHRPNMLAGYDLDIPFYRQLQKELVQYIKQASLSNDIVRCHTGMSLGSDTIWALAILDAKQDHTITATIQLVAHIPYVSQPDAWFDKHDKIRWEYIKTNADKIILTADISHYPVEEQKQHMSKAIQQTQQELITCCDVLLAIYNGDTHSEVSHLITQAMAHKPVFQIRVDTISNIDR